MNIEDVRFLFSALIQAIPTVLSLSFIVMIAFLETRKKLVDIHRKYFPFIFIILAAASGVIIADVFVLLNLEYYVNNLEATIWLTIVLSSITLFVVPLFTAGLLFDTMKLKQ